MTDEQCLFVQSTSAVRGPDEVMLAKALFNVCSSFDRAKVAAGYVRCGFVNKDKAKEVLGIPDEAMTEALDWLREEQQKSISGPTHLFPNLLML